MSDTAINDYFDNGCVHGAEVDECIVCSPEYSDASPHSPWTEDLLDFPEALWDSNLPDGEEWGIQIYL